MIVAHEFKVFAIHDKMTDISLFWSNFLLQTENPLQGTASKEVVGILERQLLHATKENVRDICISHKYNFISEKTAQNLLILFIDNHQDFSN